MRTSTFTILLTACATTATTATPKGGPRGLRASDHLDLAAEHDRQAHERSAWPETSMMMPGGYETRGEPISMPWFRSWDPTTEATQLAAKHRSEAAALQAAYDEACFNKALEEISISPLVRYGLGGWTTASGVIVYLSPKAGTPDQVLGAMKCHRAFMMLAASGMDHCPLDLPGLQLDARGDGNGITVSLTTKDSALIPELQRRVANDLETGQHRAHAKVEPGR